MKISEVKMRTELSEKAIRLYEAKGLIRIERSENRYRDYSDEDVEQLKRIKLFRLAGIAIADIQLLLGGVITTDELLRKRKKEIAEQHGRSSEQYRFCDAIGDNQASFLGSVKDHTDGVLVNIGTGSQICAVTDTAVNGCELRPLIGKRQLICGSALCGGYAYALLERFFRAYQSAEGEDCAQYERLNRLAQDAYENGVQPLAVDTVFAVPVPIQ